MKCFHILFTSTFVYLNSWGEVYLLDTKRICFSLCTIKYDLIKQSTFKKRPFKE